MLYSFFESHYETPGTIPFQRSVASWEEFCAVIERLSHIPRKTKKSAPLISPAIYENTARRGDINVKRLEFIMLDVDNAISYPPTKAVAALKDARGLSFALHTTASAEVANQQYRLCIPTDRPMSVPEARRVWYYASSLVENFADKACKDVSRAYYVPGRYPNAFHMVECYWDGLPLIVDEALEAIPPIPEPTLPKPVKPAGFQLSMKSPNWAGIYDCPCINIKAVNEYINLPRHQGLHYTGLFGVMMSIGSIAKKKGYAITAHDIAILAEEIDIEAGGTWKTKGYDFLKHAQNALDKI